MDGSYTCGENSIIYREVGSLCGTPDTNVIYVNYSQIKS